MLQLAMALFSLFTGTPSKNNNTNPLAGAEKGRMLELALGSASVTSTNAKQQDAVGKNTANDGGYAQALASSGASGFSNKSARAESSSGSGGSGNAAANSRFNASGG
jgi:hypothetical protein